MSAEANFNFDNSYSNLSEQFFTKQNPTPVATPGLMALNSVLAEQLGLDQSYLTSTEGLSVLAGNKIPEGADPIATVYAGHQFGHWNPQLGDGRAVLLGEILDKRGERFDIQLKGSGPTPYSRNGDGRAGVGPVIREFIVSEAMAALGVPTTRALAAVTTGEQVQREYALPGAVLTRVAASHIRVGTFQYFAARADENALRQLTQHVIERHYPAVTQKENPTLALLESVLQSQAELVAHWQSIGFIHGVMNTDNSSIAGLTIDYGPCAFMDEFNPETVFSSIDHHGRYAYKNQPGIAQWNAAMFAQCLLPIMDADDAVALESAQSVIDSFPTVFLTAYLNRFRKKLGLVAEIPEDIELLNELLACMEISKADFTNTFRALSHCAVNLSATETDEATQTFKALFNDANRIEKWLQSWRERHKAETQEETVRSKLMLTNNPAYIPRNHRVEEVIAAAEQQDYAPAHQLIALLNNPYAEQEGMEAFCMPPTASEVVKATFCGT